MSRGDGFPVADVDSSKHDDAKMRALWQRLRDPDRMARAVVLHDATLLSSWRHGERLTVYEAAPIWLPADEDLVAHLVAVRLLDRTHRVSPSSWKRWFGAAVERRRAAQEKGRRGGLAKAANAASRALAQVEPGYSPALPDPTIPTIPSEQNPLPPSRGGRRSEGTNHRAVAAELTRQAQQRERDQLERRKTRQRAYLEGRLTEAQRDEMNERDAPLDEIPAERGAAYVGGVA